MSKPSKYMSMQEAIDIMMKQYGFSRDDAIRKLRKAVVKGELSSYQQLDDGHHRKVQFPKVQK
jgi:hypothetical protein